MPDHVWYFEKHSLEKCEIQGGSYATNYSFRQGIKNMSKKANANREALKISIVLFVLRLESQKKKEISDQSFLVWILLRSVTTTRP